MSYLQPRSAPPNTKYNQKLYVFVKPSGFATLRAKVLEEGGLATMLYIFAQTTEGRKEVMMRRRRKKVLIVVAGELLDI